ncbi:hypothetical protein WJX77_010512 [Trebouxia sp. C0004]
MLKALHSIRVKDFVMTASVRHLPAAAAHILLSVSLYSIACSAFPSTTNSTQRATAPSAALGYLKTLTNLTLRGILPDLPDAWGVNDSFPALQAINAAVRPAATNLGPKGRIQATPGTSRKQLQTLSGTVPSAWGEAGSFPALSSLQLGGPLLNGTLPAQWGSHGTLAGLIDLELANGNFSGTLPPEWGAPDVFKNLSALSLTNCSISGTLAASWAEPGAFASLKNLTLDLSSLSGMLPPSWGSNFSFPVLDS